MMKYFFLMALFINCNLQPQKKSWSNQPIIKFDNNKNLIYKDPNSNKQKTIFPIMLYSFNNWNETKSEDFWNQIEEWGANIVYSWDIKNENKFIQLSNKHNVLALINGKEGNNKSTFISLPDEPIGGGTADVKSLRGMRGSLKSHAISYLNHDVAPYFYRKRHDPKNNPFDSKLNCKWCKQGRGTNLSYTEANQFADILAFDFYPYNNNGIISRNVNNFGNTSVGEFTKLLKERYPSKPIWPVIQTLWFSPFNEPYKGKIINHQIIRNLTFDAIINGADGVSFFGHGQTKEYENKGEYKFLKGHDNNIWYSTLCQVYELKVLQENYDKILLEDNMYSYSFQNLGYSYSIKKVNGANKYYFFVVNHKSQLNRIIIESPVSLNVQNLQKIGKYNLPKLTNISNAKELNMLSHYKINKIEQQKISIELQPYSVAIFSL